MPCKGTEHRRGRPRIPSRPAGRGLVPSVQLAAEMTRDVRQRVVRARYGRRDRFGDAGYGLKRSHLVTGRQPGPG